MCQNVKVNNYSILINCRTKQYCTYSEQDQTNRHYCIHILKMSNIKCQIAIQKKYGVNILGQESFNQFMVPIKLNLERNKWLSMKESVFRHR